VHECPDSTAGAQIGEATNGVIDSWVRHTWRLLERQNSQKRNRRPSTEVIDCSVL